LLLHSHRRTCTTDRSTATCILDVDGNAMSDCVHRRCLNYGSHRRLAVRFRCRAADYVRHPCQLSTMYVGSWCEPAPILRFGMLVAPLARRSMFARSNSESTRAPCYPKIRTTGSRRMAQWARCQRCCCSWSRTIQVSVMRLADRLVKMTGITTRPDVYLSLRGTIRATLIFANDNRRHVIARRFRQIGDGLPGRRPS
jgi:hypothetical protein